VPAMPEHLVDADRPNSCEVAVLQAPFDSQSHGAKHRIPARPEHPGHFLPAHALGPARQKPRVRRGDRTLAFGPWHSFDRDPAARAVDATHRVRAEHEQPPHRHELEEPHRNAARGGRTSSRSVCSAPALGCRRSSVGHLWARAERSYTRTPCASARGRAMSRVASRRRRALVAGWCRNPIVPARASRCIYIASAVTQHAAAGRNDGAVRLPPPKGPRATPKKSRPPEVPRQLDGVSSAERYPFTHEFFRRPMFSLRRPNPWVGLIQSSSD